MARSLSFLWCLSDWATLSSSSALRRRPRLHVLQAQLMCSGCRASLLLTYSAREQGLRTHAATIAAALQSRVPPLQATHAVESGTVEDIFPSASTVCARTDSRAVAEHTPAVGAEEVIVCHDFARGGASDVEYELFVVVVWV